MKNNSDDDNNNLVGILQEEDPESQLVLPHPPGVARLLGRQIVLPGDKVVTGQCSHHVFITHRLLSQYLSSLAPAPGDGRQLTGRDRGMDREGTVIKL